MADNNINNRASENNSNRTTYTPLLIVGSLFGGLTLLFFMVLVILSAMSRSVPPDDRYLVIIILGLGSALSASFVGGSAAAKGDIPITVARNRPFSFSVGGGVAVLIIVLVLGWALYLPKSNGSPTPQIDTVIKLKEKYDSNPDYRLILSNIETCKPLYKSWGGPLTYQQINAYLGFLDDIGLLYKHRKIDKKSIDETLGQVIVATYSYHEIRKYIDGIRSNAKQPLACSNFYKLAEELCEGKEEYISMIRKCK